MVYCRLFLSKIVVNIFVSLILLILNSAQINAQCSCTEYIYLNEISNGGSVHKYEINPDGSLTEVLVNGNAWYPGSGTSELPFPHGLAPDLNGNLYVGEHILSGTDRDIRRLSCDGEIVPESEFKIDRTGYNFGAIGNVLYINPQLSNAIEAYDLCTGDFLYEACLGQSFDGVPTSNESDIDWGFTIDDEGNMYVTAGFGNVYNGARIWKLTEADFGNGQCTEPWLTEDSSGAFPAPGDMFLPTSTGRGITVPGDGFMYYVELNEGASKDARILQYTLDGQFVAATPVDNAENGTGYYKAHGIVYSETSGYLYVSTTSDTDDCVSIIDPSNMSYVGAAVPSPGNGTVAKGMNILNECCPSPNNQVVNRIYCRETANERIFLNEIFPCDGIICEGQWIASSTASEAIFNECDQSILVGASVGCYNFSKQPENGTTSTCGEFQLDFNIEIIEYPEVSVSTNQNLCGGNIPSPLSATTNVSNVQWQMNTTSCDGPWTDIVGANSTIYAPPVVTQTTYYQVVASGLGNCMTGTCETISDCITVVIEECYDVSLSKSVDLSSASLGSPVVFTIIVENLGDAVTGAMVNDVLPTGLTYNGIYTTTTGTYDGTNWTIGNMAAGQVDSIQITVTADAEGVLTNEASISINETETEFADNQDRACISVPVQVCNNETIDVDLVAEPGLTTYQWYKNGVAIAGAMSQTYTATETGIYTYTVDGAGPTGDCEGELCCPIVIEQISCCAPFQCVPVVVTKVY